MPAPSDFAALYAAFDAPIQAFDCGAKCAPYNGGVPVCCDTRHSVPAAYQAEWVYLIENTDLWHPWQPDDPADHTRLSAEAGPDLVLIECRGAARCQREFRSLACRSFPFFPYHDSTGGFLGLACYHDYEDRCWVISNLDRVDDAYRDQFVRSYERLFALLPDERESFRYQSERLREALHAEGRRIPLLHRAGGDYLVDPVTERLERIDARRLAKHGPYAVAERLRFPDEIAAE
ncbi:MAG TPA: hypothetical protein VMN57_10110 [Anaerolineales bacterium]|nr:hypothetical protein [Anaerolineales bacterium]